MASGIVMVACSVGGLRIDGFVGAWPFRALTAAMLAAVACTWAKGCLVKEDGRKRTLRPAVAGSCCHAAVRLEHHVMLSDLVSISMRRGEMSNELQLRHPCTWPAAADMQSSSRAVGLDMVFITPTIVSKPFQE